MTVNRRLHLLADQVVGEQHIVTIEVPVKDVQDVLTIGREHATLVLKARKVSIEDLVLPILKKVPTRKDDPVILGQLEAGLSDRVDPLDAMGPRREHQVAIALLAIGQHLEQDQRTDACVVNLGVVQALIVFLDGLVVDALPRLRVVLDLEREVAPARFDEELVFDIRVRHTTGDLLVARGLGPLERMRWGKAVLAVAAIVDVADTLG